MAQTHVHDDPAIAVPNRAVGYRQSATGLSRIAHADLELLVGTTGVLTTVRDMLRWQRNLADVRVGDPALVAAIQTPMGLADGTTAPYGLGLWIEPDGDLRTVGHGGGDPGYAAHVRRYPDRGIAVAVLCNLEDVGLRVGELTRRVARVFLGEDRTTSSSTATSAAPDGRQLPGIRAGAYDRDLAREPTAAQNSVSRARTRRPGSHHRGRAERNATDAAQPEGMRGGDSGTPVLRGTRAARRCGVPGLRPELVGPKPDSGTLRPEDSPRRRSDSSWGAGDVAQ